MIVDKQIFRSVFMVLIYSMQSFGTDVLVETSLEIPKKIVGNIIGSMVYKAAFNDKTGLHFLVLSQKTGAFGDDGEIEFIWLFANQFVMVEREWKKEWVIHDYVECQGVDIECDFFTDLISFTDLDSNGVVKQVLHIF